MRAPAGTVHSLLRTTPMRVVIAMMKHETNTFSPLPTPLVNFGRGKLTEGPAFGDEAIAIVTCSRAMPGLR